MMSMFGYSSERGDVMDSLLLTVAVVSILMWFLPMGIALWRGADDIGAVFMISILCLIMPLCWFIAMYAAFASPRGIPAQRAYRR